MLWWFLGGFGIIVLGTFVLIIINVVKGPRKNYKPTRTSPPSPTIKQGDTHIYVTVQAPRENSWSIFKVVQQQEAERKAQIERKHRYHSRQIGRAHV